MAVKNKKRTSNDWKPAGGMAILSNVLNLFCPPGKSLLISRNRVKPRNQKYFASHF
jgi:hypothetical protein